jgi:hypothetical protein
MSLLPNQIIPQTMPFGTVNDDGTVTIEHDWWLLIYALCEQILANGSGASTLSLAELALLQPKETDVSRQIANIQTMLALIPNTAGRIAALERQVADLTQQVAMAARVWN